MIWRGKLIGLAIGLLLGASLRRPFLLVVGLLLGHLYDSGFFAARAPPAPPPAPAVDPYAILGVSASASDDEVEQAYRRRMSEYHPDRVANSAKEIRDLAELRAREVNGAHETIKRQRGR
ncbi:MAG: DnaJ domain-containing protein [Frankiaceae bacterium]|nr:DnaJ domain-containing protein [Arenimonas sp.]